MISGQTASRDVSYISQGLVPDLPFQSNPRDQFRWLHQSQRRCFEQGGSLSRTEWVKSNLYKLFDYIVFVSTVFVWFVILFLCDLNFYRIETVITVLKIELEHWKKILVCFIACKSLQIYSLYIYRRFVPMLHCHKNLMLLQVIWRRRRASCLWRTTTRRTSEITRHWPWGTCCRRPGTCYVSSTDPSMSTCPGFSTRTSTCGQTDRLRNRYQTIVLRGI